MKQPDFRKLAQYKSAFRLLFFYAAVIVAALLPLAWFGGARGPAAPAPAAGREAAAASPEHKGDALERGDGWLSEPFVAASLLLPVKQGQQQGFAAAGEAAPGPGARAEAAAAAAAGEPQAAAPPLAALPPGGSAEIAAVGVAPAAGSGGAASGSARAAAEPPQAADAAGQPPAGRPRTAAPAASPPDAGLPLAAAPVASPPDAGPLIAEAPAAPSQAAGPPDAAAIKAARPVRSIPVLNYHSIAVDPGNRAVVPPDVFEAQMQYLVDHGFTTLTLRQFTDFMEGAVGEDFPAKPVLLTFDDGYADNHRYGLPILRERGLRATLFVSPGTTDDGYFMNWDQIAEMHEAGWDIQPHGMTHPHLPRLSAERQAYEITEARRQIEARLNKQADVFCYPYGERNAATLRILQEQGFRYAFTIDQGVTTPDQKPLLLTRLFVNGQHSLKQWADQLERASAKGK